MKELMFRKGQVIQEELDVIATKMNRYRIDVIRGTGRIESPNKVVILDDNGEEKKEALSVKPS